MLSDPSPSKPRAPQGDKLADEGRFLRSWFEDPLRVGAVSPSGRALARMMARYVDPQTPGPVIELGPGTGSMTRALLARGLAPERLFLIEFDPNFCKLLKERFPGVNVIEGDAYAFRRLIEARTSEPAAAVVSSLPLLVKPETQRLDLLADAFACMRPEGVFIQFTYGPASPMPRFKPFGPTFRAERSPQVWLNIPPASVWVYQAPLAHSPPQAAARSNPAQALFERLRRGTEKIQIGFKREIDGAKGRFAPKPRLAPKAPTAASGGPEPAP
jgi:phosphatidylethanolamine/phosphatidyl-N-methylethanolamine N-methyltransferase